MLDLYLGGTKTEFESFTFPGGEEHVRVTEYVRAGEHVTITAMPKSSSDVMRILLLKDAIDRLGVTDNVSLNLLYMPYARQDRVCTAGDPFSLELMCNLINNAKFKRVMIYDPHSEVVEEKLERCIVVSQKNCVASCPELVHKMRNSPNAVIVSPDEGATAKSEELGHKYGLEVYQGVKHRDPETGALTGFGVAATEKHLGGADVFIFDDILDAGGTFLGLAAEIQKLKPRSLTLYITHGIFSDPKKAEILHDMCDGIHVHFDWNNM